MCSIHSINVGSYTARLLPAPRTAPSARAIPTASSSLDPKSCLYLLGIICTGGFGVGVLAHKVSGQQREPLRVASHHRDVYMCKPQVASKSHVFWKLEIQYHIAYAYSNQH